MAKGTRDVSLVIRAKNEASRALDSISSSLAQLQKAQKSTAAGSDRTGTMLSALGTEIGRLRQQAGGTDIMARLTQGVDKAAQATRRLQDSSARTRAEQSQLQSQLAKSQASVDRLAGRQQKLTERLNQQREATTRAKQGYLELSAALQRNEATLAKADSQQQRYTAQLGRQDAALTRTKAQYQKLSQQITATEAPSARLMERFTQVEARLTRQTSALSRTQAGYREFQQSVQTASQALPGLTQQTQKAQQAFNEARTAQQRSAQQLDRVAAASRRAASETSRNHTSLSRNTQSIERQNAALQEAQSEYREVTQTAQQAEAALGKLGSTMRGELLRALRDSKQQLADYKRSWQQAQQAVRAAVQGGANINNPTPELRRQLEIARQQKAAYDQTRQAIQQMRTAVRAAGTDVNKLAQAQRTYQAALARIAASTRQAADATRRNTAARDRDTQSIRRNAAAQAALERRGRAAMSWAQRLRGEVVALGVSYVGLYAAINQLRGVTSAFMELEAANNRMLVAFNGNEAIQGREMRWIREEADRLGIQFGVLAAQYSKFAIAARGTAIEGAETRRIFEAVTVAARVNKLSIEQMDGTFLALSQMMSKGVVSMEELRRQMGDRLYGAFTLAADGMGITTQRLNELVSSGQLMTEDFLPKFATELEKVFSPQLSQSLNTFTTDLGKFKNEVFKTQLRVAEAGFIDGLRDALNSLSEFFQSDDGKRFFETIGAAAGNTARILAEIPQHFEAIMFVLAAMLGTRVAAWLTILQQRFMAAVAAARPLPPTLGAAGAAGNAAAGGIGNAGRAADGATGSMARLRAAVAAASAAMATSTGRAAAMARGVGLLRGALAMIGGVPGLIITGISLALTAWATGSRDVVDITGQHEEQMNRLIDTYSRVKEAAGDWGAAVEEGISGLTLDQARQNFRAQLDGMEADAQAAFNAIGGYLRAENVTISGSLRNSQDPMVQEVLELSAQLKAGEIQAREYQKALNEMLKDERTTTRMRTLIEDSAQLTQAWVDQEERVLESAAAVRELGGDLGELPPILAGLIPTMDELADGLINIQEKKPADPIAELNAKMEELRGKIPSLSSEIKLMEQLSTIDQILETGKAIEGIDKASEAFRDFLGLAKEAKSEARDAYDAKRFGDSRRALVQPGGSSQDIATELIRKKEGYQEKPYWDVNAFRAGFGSDTVTLADGSIKKVTEGMRVGVVDANRDLERRVAEFQDVVRGQVGEKAWGGMNEQQQAVLTSNAYNYGSLTDTLTQAVRSGSTEGIQQALRNQGDHNEGVNRERRDQEAFLFGQGSQANLESNLLLVDQTLKQHDQLVQKQNEYNTTLQKTVAQRFEDTAMVAGLTREMAVAKAVEEERVNAAKVGLQLTQAQETSIANSAGLTWDLAAADKDSSASKRELEQISQRINVLLETRRQLMEQIAALEAAEKTTAGSTEQEEIAAVEEQVAKLDEALLVAQEQQTRYQQSAQKTKEATAAMGSQMEETAETAQSAGASIGESLGSHMSRGMDGFLDKVRETGDVIGSARSSFLQFAADFTLHLAKMIAQQALLNLLSAAFGGAGGFWGGVIQGVSGGFGGGGGGGFGGGGGGQISSPSAGSGGGGGMTSIPVDGPSTPSAPWAERDWGNDKGTPYKDAYDNIKRYHTGGIAGLEPNEVPAVLEQGEEVLTENNPRHRNNQGKGGESERGLSVVLVEDKRDIVGAMASSEGDDVIFQYLKRNKKTVRQLVR